MTSSGGARRAGIAMNRICGAMKWAAAIVLAASATAFAPSALAHDVITTKITFDREIIRIIYSRCASCHRDGGSAFSLTDYQHARPWAKAIQEEVLERRMPPWGAVKGFGDFRNDQALTPEQIEVIADWVEGGAPEGEEKDLPPPPKFPETPVIGDRPGEVTVNGELALRKSLMLDGLFLKTAPENATFQVTAELPDGSIHPLLWVQPFKPAYSHAFLLRNPLELPRGTVIHGVPSGASVVLLPAGVTAARK
jgi:mono/diheme cytochrome c family protein